MDVLSEFYSSDDIAQMSLDKPALVVIKKKRLKRQH